MNAKIINKLAKWCADNDFEVKVKESFDGNYWFDTQDDIIYCGDEDEQNEKVWFDFVKTLGLKDNFASLSVQAFLHELGHFNTCDDLEDEDWKEYGNFYTTLTDGLISNDKQQLAYYNLTVEKEATLWMVNYINSNYKEVEKLNAIFCER